MVSSPGSSMMLEIEIWELVDVLRDIDPVPEIPESAESFRLKCFPEEENFKNFMKWETSSSKKIIP